MEYRVFRPTQVAVAMALLGVWLTHPSHSLSQTPLNRALEVFPEQVHVGDTIYIGGKGFQPNSQKTFTVTCPNPANYGGRVEQRLSPLPGRARQESGWRVDSRGQFAGWTLLVLPVLTTGARLPVACTVYASDRDNWFGTDLPGTFTILPYNQQLDRCSRRMCVHVNAVPQHVRMGMNERVSIDAWPGAQVIVTIKLGAVVDRRTVRLNWAGHADFPWSTKLAPPMGSRSARAVVHATARLESRAGDGSRQFIVVR